MIFADFLTARLDEMEESLTETDWNGWELCESDVQVLREDIAAKRKILGWLRQWDTVDHLSDLEQDHVDALKGVVVLLSYPFRDHPDWPGQK
jgi:hypothetical protein